MRKFVAIVGLLSCMSLGLFAQSVGQFAGEEVGMEFQDEQSLLSSTTFDLFENDFDKSHEVAELAHIMGRHLWTQLGNIGGQDLFQIATVQPMGPGNLAFSMRYGKESSQGDMLELNNEDLDTDGDLVTDYYYDETSYSDWDEDFRYWNIYLGYGWKVNDKWSLGFGFEKTNPRYDENSSYTDTYEEHSDLGTTYGLPNNWGGCGFDDCTNTLTFTGWDSYYFDVDRDEFFFEFKYTASDRFNVRGRIFYNNEDSDDLMMSYDQLGYVHDEWSAGTSAFYMEETYWGGQSRDYSHDGNRWGLFFDFQHVVNDLYHHDVEIGWSNYSGDLNDVAFQFYEGYYGELGITGRGDTDPEWISDDIVYTFYDSERNVDSDHFYFRYRGYWELDNATIAAGFVYHDTSTDWNRSGAWNWNWDTYYNNGDGVTTGDPADWWWATYVWGTWYRDTDVNVDSISIPVAVIMHLTPKLDLRVGAEWTEHHVKWTEDNRYYWNDSIYDVLTLGDGTVLDFSFYGADVYEDDLAAIIDVPEIGYTKDTWTDVDWSVGIKYDHSDVLDFELSVFDEGDSVSVGGRDASDNTTLFASVTISWE